MVVVDGLDFVLAAASNPGTALAMKEMLMELREVSFPAVYISLILEKLNNLRKHTLPLSRSRPTTRLSRSRRPRWRSSMPGLD